jgi:hypothetical protein
MVYSLAQPPQSLAAQQSKPKRQRREKRKSFGSSAPAAGLALEAGKAGVAVRDRDVLFRDGLQGGRWDYSAVSLRHLECCQCWHGNPSHLLGVRLDGAVFGIPGRSSPPGSACERPSRAGLLNRSAAGSPRRSAAGANSPPAGQTGGCFTLPGHRARVLPACVSGILSLGGRRGGRLGILGRQSLL